VIIPFPLLVCIAAGMDRLTRTGRCIPLALLRSSQLDGPAFWGRILPCLWSPFSGKVAKLTFAFDRQAEWDHAAKDKVKPE
jgi:hypothetical protein